MIEFEGVEVALGGTTVLGGVDLDVEEGEFLALVGPNGAGKTTLLRTANGVVSPDAGVVRLDGKPTAALSAREIGRTVATVPQGTEIAFEFDVREVVAMGRTPHRGRFETATETDRAAVETALERTDTAQFADRPIGELSGGQRQRVVLARALAQETSMLVLDEPTANLDINHQVRTLDIVTDLVAAGKTVVAAIHDLELAARFCDRMALLSGGEILAEGPPEAVLSRGRIEAAFSIRTAVSPNPFTGTPAVTPLSDDPPRERLVHVLGTGEPAARTIGRLVEAGFPVSVGPIPEGDVAAIAAREVAQAVVTVPAFEGPSRAAHTAAKDLIAAADVTVAAGSLSGSIEPLASTADPLVPFEAFDLDSDGGTLPEAVKTATLAESPTKR